MTKKLMGGIELYDLDELSRKLKVHIVTLRRYIKLGKLKASKIGQRYWISEDNLRDFVNGRIEKARR